MQELTLLLSTILETPIYKAILFIISSIFVAKLSDKVFTSLLKKLAKNTKTTMDDYIIDIVHRPIYFSILFIGFGLSISLIELSELIQFVILGILKTILVFVWGSAIFKSFIHIIKWYSNKVGVDSKNQKRLMPLFDNLGKMVIFLAAVYFILLTI